MINNQAFLDKWLGKRYRETAALGYQCVALDKKYCEEVYGITGLSFGGSAYNGWMGKGNLQVFFNKVEGAPAPGDLAFYAPTPTNSAGHTGIVQTHTTILEQNGGAGTGTGLGPDAIRIHTAPTNVLGYMRLKSTVDDRVTKFVEKYGLKTPSKSQPYSQYDTCIILSLMD